MYRGTIRRVTVLLSAGVLCLVGVGAASQRPLVQDVTKGIVPISVAKSLWAECDSSPLVASFTTPEEPVNVVEHTVKQCNIWYDFDIQQCNKIFARDVASRKLCYIDANTEYAECLATAGSEAPSGGSVL
jgi:hypothetical protein